MAKMSKAHKEALAKGRAQARTVRDYLEALERGKKRGPKVDARTLKKRIADATSQSENEADPARRLELVQRRIDLEERLADIAEKPDASALEKAFVKVAADYGDRKGITYPAWREIGVPANVLKAAGVRRTRRSG